MMPKVELISSVYVFKTNKKTWKNSGNQDLYCMAYQVSGNYDHKFKNQKLTAKDDTLLLLPKGVPYSVYCNNQGEAMCVTFAADLELPPTFIDCKDHPEVKVLFQKLMNYQNLMSVTNYCEAQSIIYKVISIIYKLSSPEYVKHNNRDKMQLAYNYIAENYMDSSLKLGEIASNYGISDKYFRSLFKKVYNTTPSQCLISMRLQSAVKLLTETNLSISDIGEMCGFSDVYYFSKYFKNKFGCSPKDYRNKSSSITIVS